MKTILSLFDFTGFWSKPYHEAGYKVIQIDIKHGDNVMDIDEDRLRKWGKIHGILAAPPCTDMACSGAHTFKTKDMDGTTELALILLKKTYWIIKKAKPEWWALENPSGRVNTLMPITLGMEPRWSFNPCDYGGWLDPPGDFYNKRTHIWGTAKKPIPKPVEPIIYTTSDGKRGSWQWRFLGGRSERTKELRSATPMGFSRAFFESNK